MGFLLRSKFVLSRPIGQLRKIDMGGGRFGARMFQARYAAQQRRVDALRQRGLKLIGWVANETQAGMAFADENVAALAQRIDAPLLGRIPRLEHPSAEAAAAHIDFTELPNWPTRNKL